MRFPAKTTFVLLLLTMAVLGQPSPDGRLVAQNVGKVHLDPGGQPLEPVSAGVQAGGQADHTFDLIGQSSTSSSIRRVRKVMNRRP